MQQFIKVAARDSKLSRCQVKEVEQLIHTCSMEINFQPIYIKTYGDLDRNTSLRDLDKTDFFTREVDALVLNGTCQLAIHSAKDLPFPLTKGLALIALTKGIDPSDSLVLRQGESLQKNSVIATSSKRREENVQVLRTDVRFVDIRGTIEERLQQLESGAVDGVVVAEAALIRLGLTHLNRMRLPGDTAPMQGQLALLALEQDHAISCRLQELECFVKK